MTETVEKRPQVVHIALKEASSECSVLLGDVNITHLVNEVRVESKVGCLTKVFLGMTPLSTLVTVNGYAVVSAIDKEPEE